MKIEGGQKIICEESWREDLSLLITSKAIKRIFVVCGKSFYHSFLYPLFTDLINELHVEAIYFSEFHSNPQYDSLVRGMKRFKENCYDFLIGIGGGSAIDLAKCIKLSAVATPFLAIPTTAGSGSEATQFAVIYRDGEKESIEHEKILPDYILFLPRLLRTLPEIQRKTAMMDALAHSVESLWSVNSTDESMKYAHLALTSIYQYMSSYLENTNIGNEKMQQAAYLAGKAINISRTTAAHAMSYKLTSFYRLPHGQAVAVCLPKVWRYMKDHMELCKDYRGASYLDSVFRQIAADMGETSVAAAVESLERLLSDLQLDISIHPTEGEVMELVKSVNQLRLKNNPVLFSEEALLEVYKAVFEEDK